MLPFELPSEEGTMSATAAPASVFGIKERLIKVIAERLNAYKTDGLKLPEKSVFLSAAKAAFQKYVVAFDIPYLGPIVEDAVDRAMLAAFMQLVEAMYDRFAAKA